MLKVFNKIKLISLCSLLISAYVFAQGTDTWSLDNSAVKRATAGQFSTDSDKVSSKDIFDLQRAFLSVGYLGGTSFSPNGGGTDDVGTGIFNNGIQGAFGVPFANGMYLALTARYKFDDKALMQKDKDGNMAGYSWTINSQTALRAALRINDMAAIHYYFGLQPNAGSSVLYSIYKDINNTTKDNISIITHNAVWTHEIAASIKFGEHKLNIPIGIVFHANNTKHKDTLQNLQFDYVQYNPEDYISLYLNPEVNLAIASGPMTGITVGANIGFGVNNNFGQNGTGMDTTSGLETKYEGKQGKDRFAMDIYASFPLSWTLGNDQIRLAMEPKLSLGVAVTNTGNAFQKIGNEPSTGYTGYNSEVKFIPYAELPIGTTWQPVEWWQLRAGTALMIQAETTWSTIIPANAADPKKLDETKKTVNTVLTAKAGIAGFFGMGFIVGEDFDIDLYAEVSKLNITDLSFGGQLTYRFN